MTPARRALPEDEGATVALEPLMLRSDDVVFDADGLEKVKVDAKIIEHMRGAKDPRLQVQAQARLQEDAGPPPGADAHRGHRRSSVLSRKPAAKKPADDAEPAPAAETTQEA